MRPAAVVLLAVVLAWYAAAAWLNTQAPAADGFLATLRTAWSLDRPLLPAPHQVAWTWWQDVTRWPPTSPRSLIYHAGVTAASALVGLALALGLGLLLAVAIVHVRLLDRTLMPWMIASQTVPVLAIAPMVVVVLGNAGITGLLPKALIAGYLAFFPIAVGLVAGLRAPDPLLFDLLRSYAATRGQVLRKLRWPASMGFLLPSLRVAVSLALVGAIVAELPTGAQAGLGARLLAGSYYGQILQLWATLAMAALLAMLGLAGVDLLARLVAAGRGGRL
jgi:NitT/TauT family transport system permease protein